MQVSLEQRVTGPLAALINVDDVSDVVGCQPPFEGPGFLRRPRRIAWTAPSRAVDGTNLEP